MVAGAGAGMLAGCKGDGLSWLASPTALGARPGAPNKTPGARQQTFAAASSTAVLHVPPAVQQNVAAPLLVYLHGAFREANEAVSAFQHDADANAVIVLAPFASVASWDAINDRFGPDIAVIDAALRFVFERWTVDPARITLAGFSDGGTYSLGVGRANGDLFTRVVAWSPGFLLPVAPRGKPPFLITHGTDDQVLPIEYCSRVIVPELESLGYTVDYREWDGPHAIMPGSPQEVIADLGAA